MDFQFGVYQIFGQERRLDGPSGQVSLGDRSCDILMVLLEHGNSVVSKNELLDAVWPNLAVEENTLQVHISTLRKVLGPHLIKTVHGRGYQYVGPAPLRLDEAANVPPEPSGKGVENPIESALGFISDPTSTHVLVWPFAAVSDDKSGEVFADGLWEDIVIELGRYRHLRVTPYRIRLGEAEHKLPSLEAARKVAADFMIEGTLRFINQVLRMTLRLMDVETGEQIWGERFDFAISDVFSVQDAIVDAVISHLSFNLDDAARLKRQKDPTTSETAYTYFLKARSAWRAGDEALAMQFAQNACQLDPNYGRAHAYVAYFYSYSLFSQNLGLASAETTKRADEAREKALNCDRTDPFILQKLSMALIMLGRPRDGLRLSEAALRVGARDGELIVTHGHALIACGAYDEGQAFMEQAMSLARRFVVPPGFYCGLGECRHICRDYTGSLAALDMLPAPPYDIRLLKAANLARLGEVEDARRIIESAPEGFSVKRYVSHLAKTCGRPEDIEHILESFRLAGVQT